jgi:hypothetical protein
VILQYPYGGMDYQHDPDMVLPPREVWDQIGMFVHLCFVIFIVQHMIMYICMLNLPFFLCFHMWGPKAVRWR